MGIGCLFVLSLGGRQAGDYCVEYKGNFYNIYSNNVTII